MANLFISLPIELASNELLNSITSRRLTTHRLVCYSTREDVIGFSGIYSSLGTEIMCRSEEEFLDRVRQQRLLRIL